jgi:hypothetical protein
LTATRFVASRVPGSVDPVTITAAGLTAKHQRRVPKDGVVMVTGQRLRVGRIHAGITVTIVVEDHPFRVLDGTREGWPTHWGDSSRSILGHRPKLSAISTPIGPKNGNHVRRTKR